MTAAALPLDEIARLGALCACGVLDTPTNPEFDTLTATDARDRDAPMSTP